MPKIASNKGGVNDSLFRDVIGSFIQHDEKQIANIVDFTEATWGLNFRLTPVQKFMLKGFYGIPLDNVHKTIIVRDTINSKTLFDPMTEIEFAKWSYDEKRCNINLADPKNKGRLFYQLLLAVGRRSGKSILGSIIIDYEFYRLCKLGDPHKYYNVPPGHEIAVIGSGPTDGQAQIVFDQALTFSQNSHFLRDRLTHETQTYFQVQTENDIETYGHGRNKKGSIQFITGGSSSTSIRGHNAIVIAIDEMAFFIENSGKFSIDELYGALTPSIAKFKNPNTGKMDGKIICMSSPYAHFGKFYSLFRDSFSEENQEIGQHLTFKYYTALVNSGNAPEDYLRDQRRQDRAKFRREFEAEFDERITSWIDSEVQFRRNIKRPYQEVRGRRGIKYFFGFDLGVTDNGTAVSVIHKEGEVYYLDYSEVFYSGVSPIWEANLCTIYRAHEACARWRAHNMLPLMEIADFIARLSRDFPMYKGVIDQFSGHAFFQILALKNITAIDLVSVNENMKCQMYQTVKDLYTECLLDIMDHPVLIPEMLNLEAELRPGNKVAVNKRTSTDGSFQDDISDSYVRAVWECWKHHNIETGVNSSSKVPAVIAFGSGVRVTAQQPLDGGKNLMNIRSATEYKKVKLSMHGDRISTRSRDPKKRILGL